VLDALRAELKGCGVDVKNGRLGYRLMVIVDADGNELYSPYPNVMRELLAGDVQTLGSRR
jgi:hypothetical protein